VDDDFFLALEHESGARSHLWGTMMAAQLGPRYRALGSRSAYVKWGLDPQEDALRGGASPRDDGFGEDPEEAWGRLGTDDEAEPVPTERGRYVEFYEQLEQAIRDSAEAPAAGSPAAPVPLDAGVETLRIIEAARRSSEDSTVVTL
jgi:predicted dehydrogenase